MNLCGWWWWWRCGGHEGEGCTLVACAPRKGSGMRVGRGQRLSSQLHLRCAHTSLCSTRPTHRASIDAEGPAGDVAALCTFAMYLSRQAVVATVDGVCGRVGVCGWGADRTRGNDDSCTTSPRAVLQASHCHGCVSGAAQLCSWSAAKRLLPPLPSAFFPASPGTGCGQRSPPACPPQGSAGCTGLWWGRSKVRSRVAGRAGGQNVQAFCKTLLAALPPVVPWHSSTTSQVASLNRHPPKAPPQPTCTGPRRRGRPCRRAALR